MENDPIHRMEVHRDQILFVESMGAGTRIHWATDQKFMRGWSAMPIAGFARLLGLALFTIGPHGILTLEGDDPLGFAINFKCVKEIKNNRGKVDPIESADTNKVTGHPAIRTLGLLASASMCSIVFNPYKDSEEPIPDFLLPFDAALIIEARDFIADKANEPKADRPKQMPRSYAMSCKKN